VDREARRDQPRRADAGGGGRRTPLSRLARRSAAGKTTHIALAGGQIGTAVLRAAGAALGAPTSTGRSCTSGGATRCSRRRTTPTATTAPRAPRSGPGRAPASNVHAIAASDVAADPDAAAAAYADELSRFGTPEQAWPEFYVCFLGVGSDGHIASLFPDRVEIQLTDRTVVAVRDAPKPPPCASPMTRP
jgi:6-phosphogluconolactonase